MALQVTNLQRKFVMEKDGRDIELKDPGEHLSPEEVHKHYMPLYPELTNATLEGPKVEGGRAVYRVDSEAGTHG